MNLYLKNYGKHQERQKVEDGMGVLEADVGNVTHHICQHSGG